MSFLIDVDLNEFKKNCRTDAAFFWTETKSAFVLIKPMGGNDIFRTAVMKKNKKKTEMFRLQHLNSHTSKFVLRMTVDGIDVTKFINTSVDASMVTHDADPKSSYQNISK